MHDLIIDNGGKKISNFQTVGFSNLENWYLSTLGNCQLSKVAKLAMVFLKNLNFFIIFILRDRPRKCVW